MNFKEIEYKYFANNISLDKFKQTIKDINMKITGITEVKSTDDYFKSTDTKVNFLRYRHNDTYQELTLKKKTNSSNNNNRIEINLKTNSDLETVSAFVEMLGYTHSFTIQKDCYIVHFENGEIVHYTVMDANGDVNNFIEIEAHTNFNDTEAFEIINQYEKYLEPLGITYKNRLKRSLFEIYNQNV